MPGNSLATEFGIIVKDSTDGQSIRFILPRRQLGQGRFNVFSLLIPLGLRALIGTLFFSMGVASIVALIIGSQFYGAAMAPVTFGLISLEAMIPLRALALFFFARTELELTPRDLITRVTAGPIRAMRRVSLDELRTLSVEIVRPGQGHADNQDPSEKDGSPWVAIRDFLLFGNFATGYQLVAHLAGGRGVSLAERYPVEMLRTLQTDLSERCGLAHDEALSNVTESLPKLGAVLDRAFIPELPPGSAIRVETLADRVEIHIPPLLTKYWMGPLKTWGLLTVATIAFASLIGRALIDQSVTNSGNPIASFIQIGMAMFGVAMGLLLAVFWYFAICMGLRVLRSGPSSGTTVSIDAREVSIASTGRAPAPQRRWLRSEIVAASAEIFPRSSKGGFLIIELRENGHHTNSARILTNFPHRELKWLAETIGRTSTATPGFPG